MAEPDRILVSRRTQWRRLRRLLGYAVAFRWGWLLIIAVTLLSTAFSVLQPWPMKVLVDHVLPQGAGGAPGQMPPAVARFVNMLPGADTPAGLLAWIACSGLVVFAINAVLEVVLTLSWVRVGQAMVYNLAGDLFARVQRRSLLFHTRSSVGDSMCRITGDSWCVHTVVDTLLFAPLHSVLTAAMMVVLMWRMNPTLALLSVAVAPFMTVSTLLLAKRLRTTAHAQREVESRIHAHVQQTLTGIPVVQAFAQEHREHDRFQQFAAAALRAARRSTLAGSVAGLGTGLITTVGTALVLGVGARQVLQGSLTVGSLLVFLAYLGSLQAQLKAFAGVHVALQTAGAGIDRVCEILEAEPDLPERPDAVDPGRARGHVRFEHVTFGYEPDRPVLRDVCLEALPGQVVAIVGPTGAGKSTLMGMPLRLTDPWEGRVTLDGRDLRDLRLRGLRGQVAVVLQEPFLFPISVADNIAFGRPGASRQDVEAAARAANADEFIRRLPEGYDTVIGERGSTLSGGQRQRLSIARALLKDAPVLILDEPTSALDAGTEQLILDALRRLMSGRTTFVIAHRLSTVRDADCIAVIDDGRIVESGTHAELLSRGGMYARLNALQAGDTSPEPAPGELAEEAVA